VELGLVDLSAVPDPAGCVAQIEDVVSVDEAEHPGHVDHQPARDVARVARRMRALLPGQRQVVVSRHPRADEVVLAIDGEHLVDEQAARAIGTIGGEVGIERHGATHTTPLFAGPSCR